jgi:hypothetical protein
VIVLLCRVLYLGVYKVEGVEAVREDLCWFLREFLVEND